MLLSPFGVTPHPHSKAGSEERDEDGGRGGGFGATRGMDEGGQVASIGKSRWMCGSGGGMAL